MAGTGKKIKSVAGWFSLALVVFLLILLTVLWIKIPAYITGNLSDYTHKKSGGFYSLSIEKLERKLFPLTVSFHGVNFSPTGHNMELIAHSREKTLYTIGAAEIEFTGMDLFNLFKNQEFNCKKIRIVKPVFKLEGEELLQADSLDMLPGMVTEIRPIFEVVKRIHIGRIYFEEANFGFYSAVGDSGFISKAGRVAVDVIGFRTDAEKITRETGYFETDDVFIRMNDFLNDMGDSLHVLSIDTLLYSLKTTDIRAAGFQLSPVLRPADKNYFEVNVPEVYVKSRSIARFALNDSLNIRFLEFKNPDIKFYRKENPEQINLETIDNFDLYALIQNQFKKLEVDSFYLWGANLEIFRQPDTNNFRQKYKSIDIILNGFSLDSTSAFNPEKLLHADELEMKVAGYQLLLEDNEHQFSADSLFVSTFSDRIGAHKIRIQPVHNNKTKSRTEVNIECEELSIEEIILRNLYHTKTLPTAKIEMIKPTVQLQYNLEKEKRKKQGEAGLLFDLVTDYLKGVYSNLVYIENGHLNIRNSYHNVLQGYFETKFNFSLTDFSLDSASVERTDKFFYATNFDLRFSDYEMRLVDDLHKLEVENVTISSINQQVQIENLNLYPAIENASVSDIERYDRSELFHVSVPRINLQGVDLRNAFFNKKLRISNFNITDPTIHFENFGSLRTEKDNMELTEFYQLVFNYIEDFDIGIFSVPNGKLTWVNHTRRGRTTSFDNVFSASLENFRLNEAELTSERLFFSDNFDVTINDQEFELSDSVHVLKGSEIRLSSVTSSINVKNALLFPQITSEKYQNLSSTFQASIPELKIEGFDFKKAWFSQEPEIRSLELVSPRIQIYIQQGKNKPLDLNSYRFPLPSFVESLSLDEFKITNAEAVTYQSKGIQHNAQASFSFSLSMPRVLLKNDEQNQIQLSSNNIQLSVTGFKAPVDETHNIEIGHFNFDREEKKISVSGLEVAPFLQKSKSNRFSISAPKINFTGFDFNAAFHDNNFEFTFIDVLNPVISIDIKKQMVTDTVEFLQTLDLYPYAEHLVNQVRVDNLKLSDVDLNFNWLDKNLFRNKINIDFKEILLSENQPPSNLLNSKEFQISTTNLATKSKNGLYEFSADSLIYNSASHRVLMKNIEINPLWAKESFPLRNGYQTDVANAIINFAELKNINERRWIQDNILAAEKLTVGPANVEIFRNKRFPFNPNQRPPWPQDLIKNMNQAFVFDSVKLLPSRIRYEELTGLSDEPGYIEFNELTFSGGYFSNVESELEKNGNFNLDARAFLLNNSKLTARFAFDLSGSDYLHSVRGSLNPMPLKTLNSIISKSAPLAIEEGQLNRLEFDLSFNSEFAEGKLFFGYDNLKIAIQDYSGEEIQKAKFASFIANKMVINSKNPKSGELQPVDILYKRDEQRSILNYWWKSIYSGAKEILGLEP